MFFISQLFAAVLLLIILSFLTAVVCLTKTGRMQYDSMGFSQLRNDDDSDDAADDDMEDIIYKNGGGHPMKTSRHKEGPNPDLSPNLAEYHDELSSDENDEHELFRRHKPWGHLYII